MKNPQLLKIFLVFILSTAYIFSFSHFGASAYNQIFKNQGQFGDNTTIGSLDISGQSKREVSPLLTKAIEQWKQNKVLSITYKESEITVDNGIFSFQNDKTLASLVSNQRNIAVVTVDKEALQEDLYDMALSLASTPLDLDKLTKDLAESAESLTEGAQTLALENYLKGATDEEEKVSEATVKLGEDASALKELVSLIQPIKIDAEVQFSLLQKMSELDGKKYDSSTLSRLATAIYGVILPTNFTILERNISNQLPSYAKLGFEAHIDSDIGHDLVFANTNDSAYSIELRVEGKKLKATLKGRSFLNSYVVKTTEEKRYTQKTIKQYSDELAPTSMQVKKEGKAGITVKVIRSIESPSGEALDTETLSEDFYAPIHRIEVYGLAFKESPSAPTGPENPPNVENGDPEVDGGTTGGDTETEQGKGDKEPPVDPNRDTDSVENNQDNDKNQPEDKEGKGGSQQEAGGYPKYEEDPNVPQK